MNDGKILPDDESFGQTSRRPTDPRPLPSLLPSPIFNHPPPPSLPRLLWSCIHHLRAMPPSRFLPRELGYLSSLSRRPTISPTTSTSLLLRRAMLLPHPLLSSSFPPPTRHFLGESATQRRNLHVSSSRSALPLLVPLLGVLKVSSSRTMPSNSLLQLLSSVVSLSFLISTDQRRSRSGDYGT